MFQSVKPELSEPEADIQKAVARKTLGDISMPKLTRCTQNGTAHTRRAHIGPIYNK